MARACMRCPVHLARIAELKSQLSFVRQHRDALIAGIDSTVQWLDRELHDPSMPPRQVIPATRYRLASLIEEGPVR